MATKQTNNAPLAYPKSLMVNGILSFPLWSEDDLVRLQEWRLKKRLPSPEYEQRIGGSLFVDQAMVDKIKSYLTETFLPYTAKQNALDGKKGLDKEAIQDLEKRIDKEDWTLGDRIPYILPLRNLTEKDSENVDDDIVAKFAFSGSGGNTISKKFLARDDDGTLMVVQPQTVSGIPLEEIDRMDESLFWGARQTWRGSFNLNGYMKAKTGISAYTRTLYLRTDLPMSWGGGGSDDTAVLEEDFE